MSNPYDDLPPPPPHEQPYGAPPLPGASAYYAPPAPPAPAETGPVEYHRILRTGRWGASGWWRPAVGMFTLLVLVFIAAPLLLIVGFLVFFAARGTDDLQQSLENLLDTDDVTPSVLAYINLSWAAAIPCTLLVLWLLPPAQAGLAVLGRAAAAARLAGRLLRSRVPRADRDRGRLRAAPVGR